MVCGLRVQGFRVEGCRVWGFRGAGFRASLSLGLGVLSLDNLRFRGVRSSWRLASGLSFGVPYCSLLDGPLLRALLFLLHIVP